MSRFKEEGFRLKACLKTRSPFKDADTIDAELALLDRLEAMPPGSLIEVDFSGVRISSEAARRLLRRVLLRLSAGEFTDKYLVLGDLGDSLYNVDIMLCGESLIAVERSDEDGPVLR